MHISEGVLSPPVLVAGAALAAGGVAIGLKNINENDIPKVALLSSAFFVASFVHVPFFISKVHLVLSGICGLILGWAVFPALLVALLLQGVLFQFGGITVLGVNTFIMAFPAVLCRYVFYKAVRNRSHISYTAGFLCGALPVLLTGLLVSFCLVFTDESFFDTSKLILAAHIPIMIIEGIITTVCVNFLLKVKPEILGFVNE